MKKFLPLILLALASFGFISCGGWEDPVLDNSFVYIADGSGATSAVIVNDTENGKTTTLYVTLSTVKTSFDAPVEVYYEAIPGAGLKEHVDYTIADKSRSPIVFKDGDKVMPLRITWQSNPSFNPAKDNTLTIRLTGSNLAYLQMGSGSFKSSFVFTKK